MKYWLLAVLSLGNPAQAFQMKANTQCVLCQSMIRCGPAIENDMIQLPTNGRKLTIKDYCLKMSDNRNPRYRALRDIFGDASFTYGDYLEKKPILDEKKLDVEAKPILHSADFLASSGAKNLETFNRYALTALDPKKDKDLEVNSKGVLIDKTERQPPNVREAIAPAPSKAGTRSGAWVSPFNEDMEKPNQGKSQNRLPASSPTPTATPIIIKEYIRIEESFRDRYCRGKSDSDCFRLWDKYSADTKTEKPAGTTKSNQIIAPTFGNPQVSNVQKITPVAAPSTITTLKSPSITDSQKPEAVNTSNISSAASTKSLSRPVERIAPSSSSQKPIKSIKPPSANPLDAILKPERITAISPYVGSTEIALPNGRVNLEVIQTGDNLQLYCGSYENWYDRAHLILYNKRSIENRGLNLKALSRESFCDNTKKINSCKFGSTDGCSCNHSANTYFVDACNEIFGLEISNTSEIDASHISKCKEKMDALLAVKTRRKKDRENINPLFVYPLMISSLEKELCLRSDKQTLRSCEKSLDKGFQQMSEESCKSMIKMVRSDNPFNYFSENRESLRSEPWFSSMNYYNELYGSYFKDFDRGQFLKGFHGGKCKPKIRRWLQSEVQEMREEFDKRMARSLRSKYFKENLQTNCKQTGCKIFDEDTMNDPDKLQAKVEALGKLYHGLALHYKVNESWCTSSQIWKQMEQPSILPQQNFKQSPLPGQGDQ